MPELIFDVSLGEIFVVRVAGAVLDRAVMGTLEYGVGHLHTPLLVVMGHTGCGAMAAAASAPEGTGDGSGDGLTYLVDELRPSVAGSSTEDPLHRYLRTTVDRLSGNPAVRSSKYEGVMIVGAIYDLSTGEVSVLDAINGK